MDNERKYEARDFDPDEPSVARMYDYLLGGVHHYPADREGVEQLLMIAPSTEAVAKINRAFLGRIVRTLVEDYGVRQFLDHGSGLPTQQNVHQIAQAIHPDCRVVYIDNDPMVLGAGRSLLAENDRTAVIHADMRETERIFADPEVQRLIKPGVKTAALFVSVLHCIRDDSNPTPAELVRSVADRLPQDAECYMVISQLVSDRAYVRDGITQLMAELTHNTWGQVRTPQEVLGYFDGMDVLQPGVVEVSSWRPAQTGLRPVQKTDEWIEYGGVARLRR
ncbi:SAM-dependent methyltransferase [Kitasatospora sp. NPDC051984]|uniref:SAM-dependent methyltransferase n=1 Tax=Kitasatospora sp. NPDC051984 TaxID=3364059 RepID=UPI0037C91E4F